MLREPNQQPGARPGPAGRSGAGLVSDHAAYARRTRRITPSSCVVGPCGDLLLAHAPPSPSWELPHHGTSLQRAHRGGARSRQRGSLVLKSRLKGASHLVSLSLCVIMFGRFFHLIVDAMLISVALSGIKRSTGLAPAVRRLPNKDVRNLVRVYLETGEWVSAGECGRRWSGGASQGRPWT